MEKRVGIHYLSYLDNEIICYYNKAEIDIKSLYDKRLYQDEQNFNKDEDFLSLQNLDKKINSYRS